MDVAEHILLESESNDERRSLLMDLWSAKSYWEIDRISSELEKLDKVEKQDEYMNQDINAAMNSEEGKRRMEEALKAFEAAEAKSNS